MRLMKAVVVVDFDTRRILFQKIVESLRLLPSVENWDLDWGEPFLAVSRDQRIWVRIFYDESIPASAEKLKTEADRLRPHIPVEGQLCLCVPQHWGLGSKDLPDQLSFPVRLWNYSSFGNGSTLAHEVTRGHTEVVAFPPSPAELSPKIPIRLDLDQRLSSDEVRDLAEIGLALKRSNVKRSI